MATHIRGGGPGVGVFIINLPINSSYRNIIKLELLHFIYRQYVATEPVASKSSKFDGDKRNRK